MRSSLLVLIALSVASPASVHADEVAPLLEVGVQLNVLSFDAGLKERLTGDTLVIGIVHAADAASKSRAEVIAAAVSALDRKNNVTVHRRKVRAELVPYADVDKGLASAGAVYVVNGLGEDQITAVATIAGKRKLPTLCASRPYLASGLAVAVVRKENKPQIVVNLKHAVKSGMRIDSKFLRIVEIVK
jgi:hypothetical protein